MFSIVLYFQTDTTWQIVRIVGDENTELADGVMDAMISLMKAKSTRENTKV